MQNSGKKGKMMKKMKKIIALLLSMAMVLGMSVTSFAEKEHLSSGFKPTGTNQDQGNITIKNVEAGLADKISVYKIVEAEYKNPGNSFSGYKVVDTYKDIMKDTEGNPDYVTLTPEILDQLGKAAANDTAIEGITWTYDSAEEKYSTTTRFDVGRYLIVISGTDTTIYNYAVASIYYTTPGTDGNNVIMDGNLDIENIDGITLSEGEAYVKASSHPEVTKTAKKTVNGQEVTADTANVGDIITYTVEINPVPYYSGEHPVLNIVDTLSEGLSLENIDADGNLSVEVRNASDNDNTGAVVATLNKGTDFTAAKTVVSEKDTLTIDFVTGTPEAYTLNNYAGKKVVITYKAKLNSSAAMNQSGNNNDVVLNYTKDSKVSGEDPKEKDEDKTYTYTFDLSGTVSGKDGDSMLTKTGEAGTADEEKLAGAVFELYTKDSTGAKVAYKNDITINGTITVDGAEKSVVLFDGATGKVTSDNNGKLQIKGLAEGTYWLKEIEAPKGYSLNAHEFMIKVIADVDEEGTLKSWSITIDDQKLLEVENGAIKDGPVAANGKIPNTKITTLPSTGGIGTTIFTIGGCAIMIIAAALYFATRRKSAR